MISRETVVLGIALVIGAMIFASPPSEDTRPMATPANAPATTPKRGLTWDIDHDPYIGSENADAFKLGAQRVLADDPNCDLISSGSRNTTPKIISAKPFYVVCTAKDGFIYRIFFDRGDIVSQSPLRGALPYDERLSRDLCEKKIRESAEHPSTVDIHGIMGYGTKVFPNGARDVRQDFSARNSFNLELTYIAVCTVFPDGKLDYRVWEKGAN